MQPFLKIPVEKGIPLMLIKSVSLLLVGLSGGLMVAAGIYAFITLLQIIQRLATESNTAKYILFYEDCVMVGGILGNLFSIFHWHLPIGRIGLLVYGGFSGMFVGCLAIALAEMLDVIPAFSRRIKLTIGLKYLYLYIALGKGIGAFYQLVLNR